MHTYMYLVTDRHGVGRDTGLDWICIARTRTRTRTRRAKGREERGGEVCGRRPLQGTSSGCATCAAVYAGLLPPRELCFRSPPLLSSVFGVCWKARRMLAAGRKSTQRGYILDQWESCAHCALCTYAKGFTISADWVVQQHRGPR